MKIAQPRFDLDSHQKVLPVLECVSATLHQVLIHLMSGEFWLMIMFFQSHIIVTYSLILYKFQYTHLTHSEGESDDTCKEAKYMNTCENLETFCGYNDTASASGQDKLCMFRQVIVGDTTENGSNNTPPCSTPFICSSNGKSMAL